MSSPVWRTALRECANRRASPISDQITTEVNAPMPYSAAAPGSRVGGGRRQPAPPATAQFTDQDESIIRSATIVACRVGRAQRLKPDQPVRVRPEQIRLRRRAEMEQGGMDALLPAAALLEQILVQAHLGADLQHMLRRDPALRQVAGFTAAPAGAGHRADRFGVLPPARATRRRPAGSARCACTPAA